MPDGAARDSARYEEDKGLAASGDAETRRRLAARAGVRPEILYYLAEDPKAEVRRAIATNLETPVQADLILARDADDEVRCGLAEKIARLMPELDAEAQQEIRAVALEVLETLARDQLTRVRKLIAEAVKDVARAPAGVVDRVVKRLAGDSEIEVAGPVLEHSPLLAEEDLLAIIESAAGQGALAAIARRSGLGGAVSEAIVGRTIRADGRLSGDAQVITDLLANPSAQIREQTLDRIVEAAPEQAPWHGPLVRRPALPARAVRRIAGFVAELLLNELQARDDLDPETAKAVAKTVQDRIAGEKGPDKPRRPSGRDRAKEMHEAGKLDEDALSQALLSGERSFVAAGLALLASLPMAVVDKIVESKSAKGVTSLVWKAGLDMRFALQAQIRLAGIAPNATLNARNGTSFPLSEKDMRWQLEFFGA